MFVESRIFLGGRESGSVLLVVLATGVAFTATALSTVYFLSLAVQNAELAHGNQQMNSLMSQISSAMRDERSCRLTIGAPVDLDPGSAADDCYSGVNPTSCPVADPAAAPVFANPPSNTQVANAKIYRLGTGGPTMFLSYSNADFRNGDPNTPAHRFGDLVIKGIELRPEREVLPAPTNGGRVFFARLLVKAKKLGSGAAGEDGEPNIFGEEFLSIKVRSNPPYKVFSCSGFTVKTAADPAPSPIPVCVPGQGLFSAVSGQLNCVQVICPSGTPTGADASGAVICP